jgi:Domain of unknown function (DUF1905)/Bacteriocin-protection, YdeI or OmpD-Associated
VISFQAPLEAEDGGSFVTLPPEVADKLGGRARIPLRGTLNGLAFRGSTMPMGDGRHCLGFRKDQRAAAGVAVGDLVTVEVARDDEERLVELPPELAEAVGAEPALRAAFEALSYTSRKEHTEAVRSAKRPETRDRRLAAILAGLRRGGA